MNMRPHPFDPWSFVPGVVLGAFALVVLVGGVDVTGWNFSWAAPAVFIAAGLALLLGSRERRRPERSAEADVDADEVADDD
jgi:membrane protein implicated in regulation of membrane protease activity